MGGSPGLLVMRGDSFSEGCGFESQYHILNVHFSHRFVADIVMFNGKDKNKQKSRVGWPIKNMFFGSGCDSVGRAVASDTRGPWFESSYWQKLIIY